MLSDEQKEQLATEIIPLFQELEQDVIKDIARRVHKTDRWTETAELQVKTLEKLGYSPAKIQAEVWKTLRADPEYKKIVAENTLEYKHAVTAKINDIVKQAQAAGDDIIGRAGNMDFADDVDIWAAQGRHLKKSPALEQIGEVMAKRLRGDLKTFSKSTGFRTMGMPVKVTQAYNHALDRAITNVASGAFSSSQAVEMAVDEMEKSGLRKIDFASGVTRNLDVAAMLAVRTTISQMAGEISLANAESLGTDLVEVSSHPGARNGEGHGNHAAWQGKVYSISGRPHPEESKRLGYTIEKLSDATGYPDDPAGLKGYNCRHDFYPFIEGVSEPNPMAKEPDPVTIDGKTYTYYQATQKQRAMERELRELKRRYLGGRQELAGAIKAKEQQYARYCEKAGLKQNLNRLYVKRYKRDFEYIKLHGGSNVLTDIPKKDIKVLSDDVMRGLADVSRVNSNDNIKAFAEQLIDNLNIDRTNIAISVKGIADNGYCSFGQGTTQKIIHFEEYVLNGNDKRPITYRIKTAFHESFHLSAEGVEWDGLDSLGRIKEAWRSLEETFTESSAHYLLERYGVTEKIAPSYPKELVTNLPRLKRLPKYSSCNTIQDFGKIAFTDRQNGVSAKWLDLSKEIKKIKLADDYYKQYHAYILANEDELFDMFLENMPGFEPYRPIMKNDLKSAMNKDRFLLNDNEQLVYYGILSCAMQKVGVK